MIATALADLANIPEKSDWTPTVYVALLAAVGGQIVALVVMLRTLKVQRQINADQQETQREINQAQQTTQKEISERQLLGNIKSTNRQDWINQLRENIASFISLSAAINYEANRLDNKIRSHGPLPEPLKQMMYKAGEIKNLIILRLNSNEHKHTDLESLLSQLSKIEKTTNEFIEIRDKIFELTKTILKEEWNRVKKGE